MALRVPKDGLPPEGGARRITLEGQTLALFQSGGKYYALDAKCTHVGGPLDQGRVEGRDVTCPWHGSKFALDTGAVVRPPAQRPVKAFRVTVDAEGALLEPL